MTNTVLTTTVLAIATVKANTVTTAAHTNLRMGCSS